MKKIGRPTSYRKSFPEVGFKLWSQGATDLDVCKRLRISHESLNQYRKRYPEFLEAQKKGKAIADELVEHALFKRATGFVSPDCHVSVHEGKVTITALKKHYPPDPVSMIFWLKNRKPTDWRDRAELKIEQEIAGVPQNELDAFRKRFRDGVTNGNGHG